MGNTLLLCAIFHNRARMVEIFLKDGNANPNVVNNRNETALMICAMGTSVNLSIMKLLTKYRFDYAKLVNKRDNHSGQTVFHYLCQQGKTDAAIACMKYLFQVCKNIPNCSINVLAKSRLDLCGLHWAIYELNVDMVKYLLENVYFPNNDKSNPNGIAFINMPVHKLPLPMWVIACRNYDGNDAKCHSKILKLLVAYGANLNYNMLRIVIKAEYTELVCFMLQENLCPIYTFDNLIDAMFAVRGVSTTKEEIWKAFYNYGRNHNLIVESAHDVYIIKLAATINLSTFKTILSIVLAHYGINNLKQFSQIKNVQTLVHIAQHSKTNQDVKLFIDGLISGDESKELKLDSNTVAQVTLTCVNNHAIKSSNDNKIVNYKEKCSVCGDNSHGDDSLSGVKCNECKSFICDDCIIVQQISKKIDMIGTPKANMDFPISGDYETSILDEVFKYTSNKKMIGKVKSSIVC